MLETGEAKWDMFNRNPFYFQEQLNRISLMGSLFVPRKILMMHAGRQVHMILFIMRRFSRLVTRLMWENQEGNFPGDKNKE
jgi:hypothetical protein